jgi:hypothetical protein
VEIPGDVLRREQAEHSRSKNPEIQGALPIQGKGHIALRQLAQDLSRRAVRGIGLDFFLFLLRQGEGGGILGTEAELVLAHFPQFEAKMSASSRCTP